MTAALAVLSDIGIAGGLLFIASIAAILALFGLAAHADRHGSLAGRPAPVCPWCSDRTFSDPQACRCKVPCGRMSCMRAQVGR